MHDASLEPYTRVDKVVEHRRAGDYFAIFNSTTQEAHWSTKMATQAIGKSAVSSAVDSSAAANTHEKSSDVGQVAVGLAADGFHKSPSETESSDVGDGIFRQHIDKDGKQVLVVWSKDEEARVVRKADFLFLPLFSVGKTAFS